MKQRETMFCENLIDKASPSKHFKKKSIGDIAKATGIDFKKGHEFVFTKEKAPVPTRNPVTGLNEPPNANRNPITGQNVVPPVNKRCQQAGPKYAGQSLEINPTGITESKKHIMREDNIKANRIVSVDLADFKYRDQDKQERVGRYMNSSQMKGIMSVEEDRFYRGLVSRK